MSLTIDSSYITLDGKPLLDPRGLHDFYEQNGLEKWWEDKVNRFTLTRGFAPSTGAVLITKENLDTISDSGGGPFAVHTLRFVNGDNSVTISNLVIDQAIPAIPILEAENSTPYLVNLVDRRVFGKFSTVIEELPAQTTLSGIIQTIWDATVPATFGSLTITDHTSLLGSLGTMETYRLIGMNGWDALEALCETYGFELVLATDGSFLLLSPTVGDTQIETLDNHVGNEHRTYNIDNTTVTYLPEKFRFVIQDHEYAFTIKQQDFNYIFWNDETTQIPESPIYTKDFTTSTAFDSGGGISSLAGLSFGSRTFIPVRGFRGFETTFAILVEPGTVQTIPIPYRVERDADGISNLTALTAAVNYFGSLYAVRAAVALRFHRSFKTVIPIRPDILIRSVSWYDTGAGLQTEVQGFDPNDLVYPRYEDISPNGQQEGIPFINRSGYTVPPYGVMEVTGMSEGKYEIIRPTNVRTNHLWLINGASEVIDDASGTGYWLTNNPGYALTAWSSPYYDDPTHPNPLRRYYSPRSGYWHLRTFDESLSTNITTTSSSGAIGEAILHEQDFEDMGFFVEIYKTPGDVSYANSVTLEDYEYDWGGDSELTYVVAVKAHQIYDTPENSVIIPLKNGFHNFSGLSYVNYANLTAGQGKGYLVSDFNSEKTFNRVGVTIRNTIASDVLATGNSFIEFTRSGLYQIEVHLNVAIYDLQVTTEDVSGSVTIVGNTYTTTTRLKKPITYGVGLYYINSGGNGFTDGSVVYHDAGTVSMPGSLDGYSGTSDTLALVKNIHTKFLFPVRLEDEGVTFDTVRMQLIPVVKASQYSGTPKWELMHSNTNAGNQHATNDEILSCFTIFPNVDVFQFQWVKITRLRNSLAIYNE